jgi:Acetyltransferases, including N-acetylases of ribosomal proteins
MKISFAPLHVDAIACLSEMTHVDFSAGSFEPPRWFCATARTDRDAIMGVLACEFRTAFDATFNIAILDKRCINRRVMRAIFTALFSQAVRLTAEVSVNNRAALRAIERMGFVYEGYCRLGINGVEDAFVFGMLRGDCKYLPGYAGGTTVTMEMPDGQRAFLS